MIQLLQSPWEDRFRVSTLAAALQLSICMLCDLSFTLRFTLGGWNSLSHILYITNVQALTFLGRQNEDRKKKKILAFETPGGHLSLSVFDQTVVGMEIDPGVNPLQARNVISSLTHTHTA